MSTTSKLSSKSEKVPEVESEYSQVCLSRIRKDIAEFKNEPPTDIYVENVEDNITQVHALIVGPKSTPYEKGFFYFYLTFTPKYPHEPPRVTFMTTAGSTVRFNPNLYKDGKVCLSILGTWSGPAWTPAQTLSSLLVSIQSILNHAPYHNEPGFEKERRKGDVEKYNEVITHETLRVAVIGMINNEFSIALPDSLIAVMRYDFLHYYNFYVRLAQSKVDLDKTVMQDPFLINRGRFRYKELLQKLEEIHTKLNSE